MGLRFSLPVEVTGNPLLALDVGGAGRAKPRSTIPGRRRCGSVTQCSPRIGMRMASASPRAR